MREIKFRAWDKEKKKMDADVGIFPFPWNERTRNSSWSFSADGTTVNPYHENIALMQYTGLQNKHDKEIYEGDIVDIHGSAMNDIPMGDKSRKKVVWNAPFFCFVEVGVYSDNDAAYCFETFVSGSDMEIIGNIHENPELLKE